jgi:diguanylate cyclase (GGDEF)-like protein
VCDASADSGDQLGRQTSQGLRSLLKRQTTHFEIEYPCDSPTQQRWFLMRASTFELQGERYAVISHSNITQRKLAEERVRRLSRLDDLTQIANRRHFDEWFNKEWRRCVREGSPLSLAIIDIDYFKQLNDNLGHHAGDDCLKAVSGLLRFHTRRPNDLCARYGGDEFVLVYANTTLDDARTQLSRLRQAVEALNLPNPRTPTGPKITLSIGLASALPDRETDPNRLIRVADKLLYAAKHAGRNRIEAMAISD